MSLGGQKARVSLARCVYAKADVYLLDDPLSALDAHVGMQVFNNCIRYTEDVHRALNIENIKYLLPQRGLLKGRTVLLATHQLQYVEKADKIFLVDQGRVTSYKNYEEFLKSGSNLSSCLKKNECPATPPEL